MARNSPYTRKVIAPKLEEKSEYEAWLLTDSQAARIIAKFGGPYPLARKIGYDASQVFRWRYPEAPHLKRGTGGMIPQRALRLILQMAREEGVLLTDDDLTPRFFHGDKGLPSRTAKLEDLLT